MLLELLVCAFSWYSVSLNLKILSAKQILSRAFWNPCSIQLFRSLLTETKKFLMKIRNKLVYLQYVFVRISQDFILHLVLHETSLYPFQDFPELFSLRFNYF